MVNYYIYAKDFSGSTNGLKYYHSNGMESYKQFKSDVERIKRESDEAGETPTESRIIYLHWGDQCYEVSEDVTVESYETLRGNMGTEPGCIIRWIKQNYDICGEDNKIKLLYIITDGMIFQSSIDICFQMNEDMHYENVVFHAFNQNVNSIDLSVAASFLKGQCKVYRNYELFDNIDLSKEFDYEKINVDNFAVESENLKSYIKLKYIGQLKHNALALQEIDKLKKLRRRLFAELSSKSKLIESSLNTKDKELFLREFVNTDWYRSLSASSHGWKVEIDKAISTLINYIESDTKSYSFDALKFDKTFDKPAEEEDIVDINFAAEQEIEFPDIILDDEKGIPVILLTEFSLLDKIILHKTKEDTEVSPASFSKFKSTMECPLFLLNDSDISESIGYFYTLNVYKQLLTRTTKTEPRTRRPFHGGLVLIDTDELDKYNDYILAMTYFNSKKVHYNVGLFYYVLFKNCENKEWMDKNVVKQFKAYVMRRIGEAKYKIGLSSLPLDPPIVTSLTTALWYCVELSSSLFKDDPQNFMHERLRMYYGVAQSMIEILKYFDYDLNLESINKRRDLIRTVMTLKKIPTRVEKVYYLLEKIFKNVNGFLVCEIEKPFNVKKLNYLKLHHKEMFRDDVVEEKVDLNDYAHFMHLIDVSGKSDDGRGMFDICERTFRPFFTVAQNRSYYSDLAAITKKVVINNDYKKINHEPIDSLEFDKILSVYNLFINKVKNDKKYPTLKEYLEYISEKKKYHDGLVTIFPTNVLYMAEEVYSRYQSIVTAVSVETFLEVVKKFVQRPERIKAEEIMRFNNDNEINEFISGEELKVNLKKRKNLDIDLSDKKKKRVGSELQVADVDEWMQEPVPVPLGPVGLPGELAWGSGPCGPRGRGRGGRPGLRGGRRVGRGGRGGWQARGRGGWQTRGRGGPGRGATPRAPYQRDPPQREYPMCGRTVKEPRSD